MRAQFVIALIGAAVLAWCLDPIDPAETVADAGHTADAEGSAPLRSGLPAASVSRPSPMRDVATAAVMPMSLRGSEPDGAAVIDRDGRLLIDLALRRYFDWHRAAIGELDPTSIRDRIADDLRDRLPADQAVIAVELYDLYVGYLAASDRATVPVDPLDRLTELHRLRLDWFGADIAEAFFATEERALEAHLLRHRIVRDTTIAARTRDQLLGELDAALPPDLLPTPAEQQFDDAVALEHIHADNDMSEDERWGERRALFGAEAAHRLAERDNADRRWQRRLDEYRAMRIQLSADPRRDAAQRQQLMQRWLRSLSPPEQRRLQALAAEPGFDSGELRIPDLLPFRY